MGHGLSTGGRTLGTEDAAGTHHGDGPCHRVASTLDADGSEVEAS